MKYSKLSELYESLGSTTKRLEKIELLSDFFKKLDNKEVMYLLLGRVYPEYDERRIGISNQLVVKALSKSLGFDSKKIVSEWRKIGDLGKVAEKLFSLKKQSSLFSKKKLLCERVILDLRKLPELEGKGTIGKKISIITGLFSDANPLEAKYLVRTLIGDLRVGIQDSSLREGLAKAFFPNKLKEASDKIQKAIDKSNDVALVFEISKKKKLNNLNKLGLQIGKPLKVMLAQKAPSISKAFDAVGRPCAVEYKYDGFRMLIHKNKDKVWLFTRRLENVTKQFPDVVDYILNHVKGESFILDSEAVGYDKKTKEYTPFQAISQRIRRKYNIEKLQKELPIEVNVFDIIYYEGKSLLDEPFKKRSEILRKILINKKYKLVTSKQIITSDEKKAREFYKKALDDNQEGIMFKNLNAKYQPGSRVGHMLKLKPAEKDLDLVITGAEYGTGKRSGWLSSFILSCRGKKSGEYLEIGKVGTGIKELRDSKQGVTFDELNKKLKPLIISEKGRKVEIKPKVVVSVTYQEIQHSPNYGSGWALRFPRITALREDRGLHDIADLKEVEQDYKKQKRNYMYG